MKKLLPILLFAPITLTGQSQILLNSEIESKFPEAMANGLSIPQGWKSIGIDAIPSGQFAELFSNYSQNSSFSIFEKDQLTAAFTPSEFEGGVANNQWLITPEFEVTADPMLITYTVAACGNSVNNNFSIFVSEDGEDINDFYEIMGSSVKGDGGKMVSTKRRFVLDGYAGEKVRLAFISKGNSSGMVGFSDISVAPYYLVLEDAGAAKSIIIDDDHKDIAFTVKLSTPVAAKGLNAVLTTTAGYESTFTYSHPLTATSETEIAINFPSIEMNGEMSCDYKLSITPDYKDAPASEITGKINYAQREYQGVAVMEELTGTWCGYCVYGFGVMEYLQDNFTGTGDGLAVGIAVHSGTGTTIDPMEVKDIRTPTLALANQLNYPGFPYMIINRSVGTHPINAVDLCGKIMAQKSYAKVEISSVEFDLASSAVKVDFDSYLSFSANQPSINVLAYVTQNGMTGAGRNWLQKNYLNTYTKEDIIKEMGSELLPYFDPYIDRQETVIIMDYPDVARAIFPSFGGERIEGDWIADTPKKGYMEFEMPANVTDWEKSMISIILTNDATGEIIAADRIGASQYKTDGSAVSLVSAKAPLYIKKHNDGNVEIMAQAEGMVEIYSVDGRRIVSAPIQKGSNMICLGSKRGMYVVKVSSDNFTQSTKILF